MSSGKKTVDSFVKDWLEDDLPWHCRWARAFLGVYHNRIPRRFRLWPTLYWVARNALAASAPLLALYYGTIGLATAYAAAAILFSASVSVGFLGFLAESRKPLDETEALIRFGDLLSALKTAEAPNAKRSEAITACLGILEIFGRRIAKCASGDLSVSLVLYEGSSVQRMTIRHRNPGNTRPIGRTIDAGNLLGHHSCQKDSAPRVVHDTREFGGTLKSPTQSKFDYRSILIVPVLIASQGGQRIKGFVSIDCRRPYAFYGNRSQEIVVTCRPIIDQLSVLLKRE